MSPLKTRLRAAWCAYLAHPWALGADALIVIAVTVWWLA